MSKSLVDYNYHVREWIENEFLIPFLSIHSDYDLFWRLTPRTLQYFFRAEEIRQKRMHNIQDLHNYQLGLYIKVAQASNLDKKAKYFDKPKFQIEMGEKKEKQLSKKQIEAERLKLQLFFTNLGKYVRIKKT